MGCASVFQKLVSHNPDLQKLVDKGYAASYDSGYLIVRDIPYLDELRQLRWAAFVTKLTFVDTLRVVQEDHQVFFAGGVPHNRDGTPVANLAGGPTTLTLSERSADVVVQRSFSNKPSRTGVYADFFDKIESYLAQIGGPAMDLHGANPFTFRAQPEEGDSSLFKIADTLTSRAEILDLASKFRDDVVAIIGLGGTGAYLLDFLVKMPVKQIRAFDMDYFHVHNAFRSPGRLLENEFAQKKAEVYSDRYENFRHGIQIEEKYIDESTVADFQDVTFAFVCIDNGEARSKIFDLLIPMNIPFIDVGMDLRRRRGDNTLNGMVRVTYFSQSDGEAVRSLQLAETSNADGRMYRTQVQIAELNALNAALALIKFKQVRGFYACDDPELFHCLFGVSDLHAAAKSHAEKD